MFNKTMLLVLLIGSFMGPCVAHSAVFVPTNTQRIYQVDATVTDHGAATTEGNRSIKDFLVLSGLTTPTLLELANSGSGVTTAYTVTTALDMTAYPYVSLNFKPGAELIPTGGVTVYAPTNIQALPGQRIKNGTGALKFAKGGVVRAPNFGFGDVTNTDAQNGNAIDEAIGSISTVGGGRVELVLIGTFGYDLFTMAQYVTVMGGDMYGTNLQSAYAGATVTMAHDSILANLTLDGVSQVAGSIGIYGDVDRMYVRNVRVRRFEINEQHRSGIYCSWSNVYNLSGVTGFKVYTDGADNGFNVNTYLGGKISGHTDTALHLEFVSQPIGYNVFTCAIESNAKGVVLKGTIGTTIKRPAYLEGNTTNHLEIYDVTGGPTSYNTTTVLDGVILSGVSPSTTAGVYIDSVNLNFAVRNCTLSDHTWDIVNTGARYFAFKDCYVSGVTLPVTRTRFYQELSTSTWPKSITLPDITSTNQPWETIVFGTTTYEDRRTGITTADTTPTLLYDKLLTDGKTSTIVYQVQGKSTDNLQQASYGGISLLRNPSGSGVTCVPSGTTEAALWTPLESDAGLDCYLTFSGENVKIYAVGLAATDMVWGAKIAVIVQ